MINPFVKAQEALSLFLTRIHTLWEMEAILACEDITHLVYLKESSAATIAERTREVGYLIF